MLQPHVAKTLAYTQPKEVETLRAVGVRIAGVEQLAAINSAWVEQEDEQTGGSPRGKQQMAAPLQMARHPGGKQHTWEHAVYKQRGGKNNKSAPLWEMAWTRFESKGESAEKIALTWESNPGKVSAVQTATIVRHLLTALTFGKPLSLDRLLQQWKQVPDEWQWAQLEEAVADDGPARHRRRARGFARDGRPPLRCRAFTLECNYNAGHAVDAAALAQQPPRSLRSTAPAAAAFYTPETWRSVGRGLGLALLDCAARGDAARETGAWLAKHRARPAASAAAAAKEAAAKAKKKKPKSPRPAPPPPAPIPDLDPTGLGGAAAEERAPV